MSHEILDVPLEKIRINGGTQSRAELNESAISEYAEIIRASGLLPPVTVYFDGAEFWLADGFHRYHAHRSAGATEIQSEVREGARRDAVLHSVGANASHGLRRTKEDKHRAVMTLLSDSEWALWSANEIAKRCAVSHTFVNGIKSSLESVSSESPAERTYTTKHGTTATMDTSNIGKPKPSTQPAAAPSTPDDEDDSPDMAQLAGELQAENEAMQRQIKSLESDDANAELVRLNTHLDQLNGRLQGEITTRNEAQKMVKFYADLLAKIRKALNVENNKDILAALTK